MRPANVFLIMELSNSRIIESKYSIMSMSSGSFRCIGILVEDIIQEKGGQCSFYFRFPLKSRFLLYFGTKKQVVF